MNQTQKFIPVRELIIFDLETSDFTLCERYGVKIEAWNIGAVRINAIGEIKDQIDLYVRPKRPEFVTPCCRYLSKFEGDFDFPPFREAFPRFLQFVGRTDLMSWGSYDYGVLRAQAISEGFNWEIRGRHFDAMSFVAGVLSDYPLTIKSFALQRMCEFFGLEKSNHRALKDSVCAANLIQKVMSL